MIIKNVKIITGDDPNKILLGKSVRILDTKIDRIEPQDEILSTFSDEECIDAGGQYLMPGNICAHTHFYGAFSRGMAIPGMPAENFPQILNNLWWPLDRSLSLEDVRFSAYVCAIDAIKHGTTTLFDHHASQNAIEGSLDEIADAIEKSGLRASLCYEVTDRDGSEKSLKGITENLRFIKKIKKDKNSGRLHAMFGLHASMTLSNQTLEKCRNSIPDDIGFHIHVAEHFSDQTNCVYNYGKRIVDRLMDWSIIRPQSIIVHAVHIDTQEMSLLANSGCWVTHQPRSNMNNAVGIADVESMLRLGIPVCLGNDGFSNAMWEEWKASYLVHKLWNRDPGRMPGDLIYYMAIKNNSALATSAFNRNIGKIAVGAEADLILVDYFPFTDINAANLPWHIIFGFHESMITMTMVAGKILMKNGKLLTLDEQAITERALELSRKTWQRYNKIFEKEN